MKRWVSLGLAFFMPAAMAQLVASAGQLPRLDALSQQRFLQLLVQRSVEIQYSQLNAVVNRHLMLGEAGMYETTFFMAIREEDRSRQRTPDEQRQNSFFPTTSVPVLEETAQSNELGIRNKLPWGSELSLSYKIAKKSNNLIPLYNSGSSDTEYNTLLNLTLKQPLLRNAGRSVTETDRRVADLEHQIALHQLKQQTLKTSIDGLSLYWQLYRAEATLALRQSTYTSTEALLNDAKARIESGKLPASASLEVQGVLLNRQAEVVRSQQALREAQGKVATALHLFLHESTALSTRPVLQALDAPLAQAPATPEPALNTWPPYQIAQLKYEQAQTRLNYARNQMQPLADLVLGYSGTGYNDDAKAARTASEKGTYPDWYIGINIELPLQGNRKARQQFLAQSTRMTQAELELMAIKNSFSNDLLVRHSDLLQARSMLNASHDEVALRQALVDNERQRHQLGVGLLGSLIQKQVDLTEAQQRQVENNIRFEVALATWYYTQGSLLSAHQIEVASQATPPQ
jgi:outer membrane protein TolC